jgi:cell volume regulation protein A
MDDPLSLNLVMIAGLFLLGVAGERFFERTQIPDVVWLIGAGILLNATGLVEPDAFDGVLPLFAALTLIIILFEGGSQIVVSDLVRSAPRATLLSLFGFTLTVGFVAVLVQGGVAIGMLPESWGWAHGFMIGAMLGGSSSLIIMPSMALAKVEDRVASLVGLESALTDALCVVVAVAIIDTMAPANAGAAGAGDAAVTLAKSFGIALAIGVAAGWTWMPIMSRLTGSPHAYPVTLAMLLSLYVLVGKAGGSSAMGILAFAVIVGNADALIKRVFSVMGVEWGDKRLELDYEVRTVHTQISFIIKSFFFTFIGLKLTPPWSMIFAGLIVGIALLGARAPVVAIVARGEAFDSRDRSMITVSLPRGMAAGVLATLPMQAKIPDTEGLPSLVFAAVITSIVIFAVGFRKIRGATDTTQAEGDAPGPGEATADGQSDSNPDATPDVPTAPDTVDESAPVAAATESPPADTPVTDALPSSRPTMALAPSEARQALHAELETTPTQQPVGPVAVADTSGTPRTTAGLAPGAPVPPPEPLTTDDDTSPLPGAAPAGFVPTDPSDPNAASPAGPVTIPGVPKPPSGTEPG